MVVDVDVLVGLYEQVYVLYFGYLWMQVCDDFVGIGGVVFIFGFQCDEELFGIEGGGIGVYGKVDYVWIFVYYFSYFQQLFLYGC